MTGLVILFVILAIVAGIFSFGAVVSAGVAIAKVLFWIFIALLIISLLASFFYRPRRGPVA